MSRPEFSNRSRNPSKGPGAPEASQKRKNAGKREGPATDPRANASPGGDAEPGASPNPAPGEVFHGWPARDFLVSCILLTLSMQRAHGYFIEQYLHGLGLANVELSTLYRTLRELERTGLVSSSWEPGPEGPARRVYSLTDAGRWWLDMGVSALRSYRQIIDQFVDSYTGLAHRRQDQDAEKGE